MFSALLSTTYHFDSVCLMYYILSPQVSLARPSSESIKGANIYVCGLPKSMTQLDLETLFGEIGEIISSRILTDPATGKMKAMELQARPNLLLTKLIWPVNQKRLHFNLARST